jgi:hypothetical protein
MKPENVFDHLNRDQIYQRQNDFEPPRGIDSFSMTRIGSAARIEVYRRRLELGFELFHSTDFDEAMAIEKAIAEQMSFDADFDQSFFDHRTNRQIR